jgi:hypothetical protein
MRERERESNTPRRTLLSPFPDLRRRKEGKCGWWAVFEPEGKRGPAETTARNIVKTKIQHGIRGTIMSLTFGLGQWTEYPSPPSRTIPNVFLIYIGIIIINRSSKSIIQQYVFFKI